MQALRAHYKGKPFLPRSFTSANHIEQIQGVYVPFWLFDGGAGGRGQLPRQQHERVRDRRL
ncbi:MAG: hypothetical protein ACLR1P_02090 [Oscillospiraceae bacterium]